jgi:hypothetical protein
VPLFHADKENQHWQPGETDNFGRQPAPHHHGHRQQHYAQQHSSSSSDGECSSSSTDALRLAAERSARETAAEAATIAEMLNPPCSTGSAAAGSPAQQDQWRIGQHHAQGNGGSAAAAAATITAAAGASAKAAAGVHSPMEEVRRLLKEKAELLATGLYGRDDGVIMQIDARVQALAELAANC